MIHLSAKKNWKWQLFFYDLSIGKFSIENADNCVFETLERMRNRGYEKIDQRQSLKTFNNSRNSKELLANKNSIFAKALSVFRVLKSSDNDIEIKKRSKSLSFFFWGGFRNVFSWECVELFLYFGIFHAAWWIYFSYLSRHKLL